MTFRLNCGTTCRNPAGCASSGRCLATGAALQPEPSTVPCPSCKGAKRADPSAPLELSRCGTCDGLGTVPADSVAALGDDEPFEVLGVPDHDALEEELRRIALNATDAAPDSKAMGRFRDAFSPAVALALLDQAKAGEQLAAVVHRKLEGPSEEAGRFAGLDAFAARHGVSARALGRFKGGVLAVERSGRPQTLGLGLPGEDDLLRALGKAAREGAAAALPPELAEALGPDFEEQVVGVLQEKLRPALRPEVLDFARALDRQLGDDGTVDGGLHPPAAAAAFLASTAESLAAALRRKDQGAFILAVDAGLWALGAWLGTVPPDRRKG